MNLTVQNGTYYYHKDAPVFRDINFSVDAGEILAILGPNGAGKTTMLRCITGMLRWRSGDSLLDGEAIRTMPVQKLWRKMAYVPQAKSVSSAYTAFETVLLGRSSRLNAFSSPKKADLEQARQAMAMLGIEQLADKKCTAISGGELQMVLIARALASEPQVLILDEPESNLDFKNQLVVLDAIVKQLAFLESFSIGNFLFDLASGCILYAALGGIGWLIGWLLHYARTAREEPADDKDQKNT